MLRISALFAAIGAILMLLANCSAHAGQAPTVAQPAQVCAVKVTAYCPCSKCCGSFRGKVHRQTACGTLAQPGTVAADTSKYPFGTILWIPGYGYGIVEDKGGRIKGDKIDVYFHSHEQAKQWGVKNMAVKVLRWGRGR